MNFILRGIWASTMATSSMTLAMFQFFAKLPKARKSPLPPAQITRSIEKKMGLERAPSSELQKQLTLLAHYGYGAAAGVLYAAISPKVPGSLIAKGSLFGLTVWGASYLGIIPKLNLHPSAPRMNTQRNVMMIASHVVWGVALAYAEDKLRKNSSALLDARSDRHFEQ